MPHPGSFDIKQCILLLMYQPSSSRLSYLQKEPGLWETYARAIITQSCAVPRSEKKPLGFFIDSRASAVTNINETNLYVWCHWSLTLHMKGQLADHVSENCPQLRQQNVTANWKPDRPEIVAYVRDSVVSVVVLSIIISISSRQDITHRPTANHRGTRWWSPAAATSSPLIVPSTDHIAYPPPRPVPLSDRDMPPPRLGCKMHPFWEYEIVVTSVEKGMRQQLWGDRR